MTLEQMEQMASVEKLALTYAEKLVQFHTLQLQSDQSGLREDFYATCRARDELYEAQDTLDSAAVRVASQNFA